MESSLEKWETSQAFPNEKILLIFSKSPWKQEANNSEKEATRTPQRLANSSASRPLLLCTGGRQTTEVQRDYSSAAPHHCCQLKSSLLPKTRKKPRIVAKMTVFPVRTSAQAPHSIRCALANTTGSPKAETTMPVVRNMASSLHALLMASVSSTNLLAMQYGMGERM